MTQSYTLSFEGWSRRLTAALLLGVAGTALGAGAPAAAFISIGGLQSPEDVELLPDGKHLLISKMAGEKGQPGGFALLDLTQRRLTEVLIEPSSAHDWGDPACAQRPAAQISPHGIFLSRPASGLATLLAINHGDTESVHAYAVSTQDGRVHLAWRGCVDTSYNFNDLAATADGFIGAHQFDKPLGEGPDAAQRLFGGAHTGFAVRWSRARGFQRIPGTEAAFPNGITVNADGSTAWMVATAGREVRKIDLLRNVQVASASLPLAPDNLSWTAEGQLLVTGADDVHRLAHCAATTPPCRVSFAVARIDPVTLRSRVIFRHDGSMLLGASVAVIAGDSMYIGSFTGDHLLQVPAPRVP